MLWRKKKVNEEIPVDGDKVLHGGDEGENRLARLLTGGWDRNQWGRDKDIQKTLEQLKEETPVWILKKYIVNIVENMNSWWGEKYSSQDRKGIVKDVKIFCDTYQNTYFNALYVYNYTDPQYSSRTFKMANIALQFDFDTYGFWDFLLQAFHMIAKDVYDWNYTSLEKIYQDNIWQDELSEK